MKGLEGLKVGDPVTVTTSGLYGNSATKRVITKVTKTQVVLDDGSRWRMRGRKVGSGSWSREWARPWDEALHAEIARETKERNLRRTVREAIQRADLSLDQWTRIDAIMKEKTE